MVQGEAQLARLARLMVAASLALALTVAYGSGTNYLNYLRWTGKAQGSIAKAIAYSTSAGGELALTVEFMAPAVGFPIEIESLEFSLQGPEGNFGYYRIIIPEEASPPAKESDVVQLLLSSHVPPEHWPKLYTSSGPRLDGILIVRLHLPGRKVPTRIPISAPVFLEGDLM